MSCKIFSTITRRISTGILDCGVPIILLHIQTIQAVKDMVYRKLFWDLTTRDKGSSVGSSLETP